MKKCVLVLALFACGRGDDQSFHDALMVMCTVGDHFDRDAGPVDAAAMAKWIDDHVSNPEARTLFAQVGDPDAITRAVARAGITSCPLLDDKADPWAGVTMPDAGDAVLPPAPAGVTLAIAPDGVRFDRRTDVALPLDHFRPDDGDIFPGSNGLDAAVLGLESQRERELLPHATLLALVLDPATPWRTLVIALDSTREDFPARGLVARSTHGVGLVPIAGGVPPSVWETAWDTGDNADHARWARDDHPPLGDGDLEWHLAHPDKEKPSAGSDPIGLVVTITHDQLLLWSVSGKEGTLAKPIATLAIADRAGLDRALTAAAGRHHDAHQIIAIALRDVTATDYLPVLAIAHAHFVDLALAAGFD